MRHTRLAFLACLLFLGLAASPSPARAAAADRLYKLDARGVQSQIARRRGKPTVLLVYRTTCPACARFFPKFVDFAKYYASERSAEFLAVSLDADPEALVAYLDKYRGLPFKPHWLPRKHLPELDKALARLGLEVDGGFRIPFVALFDKKGEAVGQVTGPSSADMAVLAREIEREQ